MKRLKRVIAAILVFVIAGIQLPEIVKASGETIISSVECQDTVKAGETFDVNIVIQNMGEESGVAGISLDEFRYDSEKLSFVSGSASYTAGPQNWQLDVVEYDTNVLRILMVERDGIGSLKIGEKLILNMKFAAKNNLDDTTTNLAIAVIEGTNGDVDAVSVANSQKEISIQNDHVWNEWEIITEATCKSNGLKRRSCANPGCTKSETEIISKLEHDAEWTTVKEATCLEEGQKQNVCKVCHSILEIQTIEKAEHELGDWEVVQEPTCEEAGEKVKTCVNCGTVLKTEQIDALGHNMGEWTVTKEPTILEKGEKQRDCSRCDYKETEEIPAIIHGDEDHVFNGMEELVKEATCTEAGSKKVYCSVEGCTEYTIVILPELGHDEGAWEITKEPTCTENGTKAKKCKVCKEVLATEEIEKIGHDFNDWEVVKESTCLEKGQKQRVCKSCGDVEKEELPLANHKRGEYEITKEPTCTEDGEEVQKCKVCNQDLDTRIVPALGHKYGEWITTEEPTCEHTGKRVRKCSVCVSEEEEILDIVEHQAGDFVTVKEPTCTETGVAEAKCSVCNKVVETKVLEAIGHQYSEWVTVKEPTFNEDGLRECVCAKCGDKLEEILPKLSDSHVHDFSGEEVTIKEPTCEEKGEKHVSCIEAECDAYKIVETPAIGHQYGEWIVTKEPTYEEAGIKERVCTVCEKVQTAEIAKLVSSNQNEDNKEAVENSNGVKTGDSSNYVYWFIALGFALVVIEESLRRRHLENK